MTQLLAVQSHLSGPLFTNASNSPITDTIFRKVLRKAITKLGLNPSVYTPHSFRIGGATLAHELNYSDSQIRQIGRWKSVAFNKYVRPQNSQL